MKHRLPALDWMRGIAMVLMATDHASEAFNAARPAADSALFPGFDQPLDTGEFLFRWLSHLCAPTFLFLAGTSLALSIERKRAQGKSALSIDLDLLIRALLILAAELFFINWFWEPGILVFQVMFAISASMLLMIVLRRLPDVALLLFALVSLCAGEWTRTGHIFALNEPVAAIKAFFLNAAYMQKAIHNQEALMVAYPVLPWCAMMAMGWVLGRYLLRQRDLADGDRNTQRLLLFTGVAFLACFLVFRGINGFGNLGLYRSDGSLVQWLHVSKYPPSLTFAALELGIMFVLLAALFRLDASREAEPSRFNPLLVFGQTAFFYYLAHIALLETAAHRVDMYRSAGLQEALIAFAAAIVVLYPLCLGYRRLKTKYPRSPLRFF